MSVASHCLEIKYAIENGNEFVLVKEPGDKFFYIIKIISLKFSE